jgi:hypothetical protein
VPETEQDRLARFLINEFEEDERWAASTAAHAPALEQRIDDILADDARGSPAEPPSNRDP